MEKAYDVNGLLEELKVKGLDLAEDTAMVAKDAVLEWLKKSASMSENPWDDMLMAAVPMFESEIDKAIDKIDKKEG